MRHILFLQLSLINIYLAAQPSFSSFVDERDGKTYKIVTIGNQTWFAENFNFASPKGSWCYNDDSLNCNLYGRLYDWKTAVKLCPDGCHLPTLNDWQELFQYLGGTDLAGGKMKDTIDWLKPNTGADNESGFSSLPSGGRDQNGTYWFAGGYAYFWSAQESNSKAAITITLCYFDGKVILSNYNKKFGQSVRYIKNN